MSDRAAKNLRQFVIDVSQAGYRRLTIALGPQQNNSPKCTRKRPADCVEPEKFEEDIAFALNVSEVAKTAASGQSLDLRFDLLNEGCVAPSYQPVAGILHDYLVRLIRAYSGRFGTSDWTVSCFFNPRKAHDPWRARVQMLLKTFRDAGAVPHFFDFHLYMYDPTRIPVILNGVKDLISPLSMKLVIGESLYGNAANSVVLARFVKNHPGFIEEIDTWPVRQLTACRMTVPPPYDACVMAKALSQ